MKLSVVLATFNEEKNLPSCLDSVKDLADEIVIVDGTSTDATVQIARKYGAKVKITTNKKNFHINKQMAIDMATCDWILQLDADEQVSPELAKEIKEKIGNWKLEIGNSRANGYWIPRKNWFLGRFLMKGGQYPNYTLRLYRRGKGKLPQKDVHEQAEIQGKSGYLKHAILHYPYKDFSQYLNKWNRYNILFAGQIKEEQKNKNIFWKFLYLVGYLFVKPSHWFLMTYFRHKGFMDSWQGFLFSLFSALRFPASYIKYLGTYKFAIIIILLTAAVLRFYDFQNRWGLGGDDARDALIALEAIKRFELPAMGSFSSAGPFVFGGMFYWFIIFSYLTMPFFISSPWIFLVLVNIFLVYIFTRIGMELGGKRLAIILGVFSATSPQLVTRSLMLGQHTFISLFSALVILFFLILVRTKKILLAFLMGVAIGTALNFHYQAINLLIFLPSVFFIPSFKFKDKLLSFVLALVGFIVPLGPLLYWDAYQQFANIRNIADYFLIAQYRIYVPNSWKLYLFDYIPHYWSFVIGNYWQIGLLLFTASFIVFAARLVRQKLSFGLKFLGIIFAILILLNRYYKGERSEGYLLYLLPFILIFTSFLILEFWEIKNTLVKILITFFMFLIIVFNFVYIVRNWNFKNAVGGIRNTANFLYSRYPDEKFSIFSYKSKYESNAYTFNVASALSLVMTFDSKTDVHGKKIGIGCSEIDCPKNLPVIADRNILIIDLKNVRQSDFDKKKKIWVNTNQESVYNDLIGWLNQHNLKSPFSFKKYIMDKLRFI